MAVVTHHPVIIHFELILLAYRDRFELICISDALIDPIVLLGDQNPIAFLRNINRTVVVACPVVMPQRIDGTTLFLGFDSNRQHMRILFQLRLHCLCQREMPRGGIYLYAVGETDAEFLQVLRAEKMPVSLHEIIVLQSLFLRLAFAVHINHIIHNSQTVSRGSHTTLHVVLSSIHRPNDDLAKHVFAVLNQRLAVIMAQGVIVGILHLRAYCIAGREVKDHDIAFLRTGPTRQALVVPVRFVQITLSAT